MHLGSLPHLLTQLFSNCQNLSETQSLTPLVMSFIIKVLVKIWIGLGMYLFTNPAVFFLTFILNINNLYSEEEAQDIWNIDSQEKKKAEVTDLSETYESSIYEMQTNKKND